VCTHHAENHRTSQVAQQPAHHSFHRCAKAAALAARVVVLVVLAAAGHGHSGAAGHGRRADIYWASAVGHERIWVASQLNRTAFAGKLHGLSRQILMPVAGPQNESVIAFFSVVPLAMAVDHHASQRPAVHLAGYASGQA